MLQLKYFRNQNSYEQLVNDLKPVSGGNQIVPIIENLGKEWFCNDEAVNYLTYEYNPNVGLASFRFDIDTIYNNSASIACLYIGNGLLGNPCHLCDVEVHLSCTLYTCSAKISMSVSPEAAAVLMDMSSKRPNKYEVFFIGNRIELVLTNVDSRDIYLTLRSIRESLLAGRGVML